MVDGVTGGTNVPLPGLEDDGSTAALDRLQQGRMVAAQILTQLVHLAQVPGGTPGVNDANGAPEIERATAELSPEDMAAQLQMLQSKTQEAQLATAKEGIKTNMTKKEEQNAKALAKINDWIKNCQDAANAAKPSGILGWLKKIGTFIASIAAVVVAAVAAVASGGVGSPLFAMAVVGLVASTMSLASAISQEAGGPPLEISTWLAKGIGAALAGMGVPKDKAEAIGKIALLAAPGLILIDPSMLGQATGAIAQLSGADASQIAIVTAVFTAVATVAAAGAMVVLSGGAGAGKALDGIAKTVSVCAKVAQGAGVAASAAGDIGQGAVAIEKAGYDRAADNAQADKKAIDAVIAKLQKQMEDSRDDLKKVMDQLMDGMTIVSQMINAAADNRSQITANLGGKGATV
jgi:hypothetical protein